MTINELTIIFVLFVMINSIPSTFRLFKMKVFNQSEMSLIENKMNKRRLEWEKAEAGFVEIKAMHKRIPGLVKAIFYFIYVYKIIIKCAIFTAGILIIKGIL